jgi:protein-disulfide isomerase
MGKDRVERGRRANVVRSQRAASVRSFYIALGVVAVIGVALIARTAGRSGNAGTRALDVKPTPAQAEGYLLGNPNAPVQIMEFADFECPVCGQYATITEPDVRTRIVATGLASYRFFDFPLVESHRNTLAASNAAACAADQGKFWEMHDRLFYGQPEWSSEATRNPKKIFTEYAKALGLDVDAWERCYDEERHLSRILSNRAEGERRGVNATPTFVIGTKMIAGNLSYDAMKAYVDTAAQQFAAQATARADSQAGKGATR